MGVVKAAGVAAFEEINNRLRIHAACRGNELLEDEAKSEVEVSMGCGVDLSSGRFYWLATVLALAVQSAREKLWILKIGEKLKNMITDD